MKKYLLIAASIGVLAGPAMADEVGVRVGPVGAGVTVGEHRDHDRTTIIKKTDEDGDRSKTIIHHDND